MFNHSTQSWRVTDRQTEVLPFGNHNKNFIGFRRFRPIWC